MSWLSDASANKIVQSYINNFMDVSGNFKVRGGTETTTVDTGPVGWTQLGSDIDGEAVDDASGYSVSISSDGSIVAIGAIRNDGGGNNSGHVRVYKWNGSSWSQLGSDIDGEAAGDTSGFSVALSSDGTIVAIGAWVNDGNGTDSGHVRVYKWNGSSWSQLGSDIDGEAAQDRAGSSVALNSDGTIVAVGASKNSDNGLYAGHMRVYEYNGSSWTQLGADIDGEGAGEYFGQSVSLSSDGTIVVVGADGLVRVYEYSGGSWNQLGSDIVGEGFRFGAKVSLSSDGTIMAVSDRENDGGGSNAGHVRIFEWNGSSWTQIGSDIDGEAADDLSGMGLSLSSNGSIVAIGAINNDENGDVRIFEWNGSSWTQIGSDINGEASDDRFGVSVSLSSDGSIVAIGAHLNDGNGTSSGHVRVYQKTGGLVTTTTSVEALDISGGTVSMLQNTMKVSFGVVDISGTTWLNEGQSGNTISEAYQKGLIIESSSTSANDAVLHVETAGQTQAFSVRANGDVYSDNTLRHSSDDRRKTNEQHITNAMETLNKLSPQIYIKLNDLIENNGMYSKVESGLIAQEIYYNAPELRHLVSIKDENGNDVTPQEYDLSGNDIQNDPDYTALGWGPKSAYVDYIGLIPYLIKANQEKQATLDAQEATITQQTSQVEDLKTRLSSLEAK